MLYDNTNSGNTDLTLAPTLETERLILRGHRMSDLAAREAMTADADVCRFIGGVQDHAENVNRILRYAGLWVHYGRGPFVVEERSSGRFLGEIGIADFERGLGPDFDGEPEGLWVLTGGAHGKGYATEAMRAAIAWHDQAFGAKRMVCIIAPDNAGSLAVAGKLGFSRFDARVYKDHPVILFERPV